MTDLGFWKGKKIFVTGHTGFKGSWLSLVLHKFGADVTGFALTPNTNPNMYELCGVSNGQQSVIGDIRNLDMLTKVIESVKPEIVFHLAAQSLVRESYRKPVDTFAINVMGTINLLEAIRNAQGVKVVVNITSDKCYENKEWVWGYRESDSLGGYDPYSNSKACAELVTAAFRSSFFHPDHFSEHNLAIATARAGNVIGGGDWAADRLIPDCIRAILKNEAVVIRNPKATRPWQHVLEPLNGYLTLAQRLFEKGPEFSGSWNFGPEDSDARSVEWVVAHLCSLWGKSAVYKADEGPHPHEAGYLKLDCSKAKQLLDWSPKWNLETALLKTVEWGLVYQNGQDLREVTNKQIDEYFN